MDILSSNLSREDVVPQSDHESSLQRATDGHVAFLDSAYAHVQDQLALGNQQSSDRRPFTEEFKSIEAKIEQDSLLLDRNSTE